MNRGTRTEDINPQVLYKQFKSKMILAICTRAKCKVPRIKRIRKQLDRDIKQLTKELSKPDLNQDQISVLTIDLHDKMQELSTLEKRVAADRNLNSKVRHLVEGERMTKYWTSLTKITKPQEIIYCLRMLTNPTTGDAGYTTHTREMAEVARSYHDQLQLDPMENLQQEEHEQAMQKVLTTIPDSQKLSVEENHILENFLTRDNIEEALKKLPKEKWPGLMDFPPNGGRNYIPCLRKTPKQQP
jgi:hypothetical protein